MKPEGTPFRRRQTTFRTIPLLLLLVSTGCQSFSHRTTWHTPSVAAPQSSFDCYGGSSAKSFTSPAFSAAESAYARAFELEANGKATCVDQYYQAATLVWWEVSNQPEMTADPPGRAASLYRSALTKLISTGQQYRRLDLSRGLTVQTPTGYLQVPINYFGFPWQPEGFDAIVPVGDYRTKQLNTIYSTDGLGVATIASRCRRVHEKFRKKQQVIAATAILRPSKEPNGCSFSLELFDSLRISHVQVAGRTVPLRRDLSAPFAFEFKDVRRNYLEAFIQPGSSDSETGLFMLEPFQRGKIPVVFVHGLLSDPLTWANIANELRARPDLVERYQIWGFEYATGEPFLESAAVLRDHLQQLQMSVAGRDGFDVALHKTVLVGHSMGGLVSKLQVTHSGNDVWAAISDRPFEAIFTTPGTRTHLADSVYFDPSPLVSRVVYVGSPHRGSPWARRSIGRFGASLVEEPSSRRAQHAQLLRDNPNAFSSEFTRRIPTSIDLLRPDSHLLHAIDRLPVARHVREHSIIGSFRPMLFAGDSDGVVPVASARRRNDVSEKMIHARHSALHQDPDSIEELVRILRVHMTDVP